MDLRTVLFIKSSFPIVEYQYEFHVTNDADLLYLKQQFTPAVLLVPRATKEYLLQFGESVLDRGEKDPRKPLKDLLLNKSRIPFIDGPYSDSGQCKRSCRTLLGHALETDDRNIYIIGIDPELFELVWHEIDMVWQEPELAFAPGIDDFSDFKDDGVPGDNLLSLLPDEDGAMNLDKDFVGISPDVRLVRKLIQKAVKNNDAVLILGETGTGKEVVAQAIHKNGLRSGNTMMAINCSSLAESLFESELFGIEKGTATGVEARKGLWETANNSTLFLDEIGELSLEMQAKILRVLQEKKLRRVGGRVDIDVNARIICATNRDLYTLVQRGHFREDLYYRLAQFYIHTPTLRDHAEDIPVLADIFWKQIVDDDTMSLPDEVHKALQRLPWPGNVRQLRNMLVRLAGIFDREKPTVSKLNAVMQLEAGMAPTGTDAGDDVSGHIMECLRRLRRVSEVIRLVDLKMSDLADSNVADSIKAQSLVAQQLQQTIAELDLDLTQPMLFRHMATFQKVLELHRHYKKLWVIVQKDPENLFAFWHKTVYPFYYNVQNLLLEEVNGILGKY